MYQRPEFSCYGLLFFFPLYKLSKKIILLSSFYSKVESTVEAELSHWTFFGKNMTCMKQQVTMTAT